MSTPSSFVLTVGTSVNMIQLRAGNFPWPPHPGEPVPSVPPVKEIDGSPLRYGGSREASCTHHKDHYLEILQS
jgi:hypothetical protein